MSDFLFSYGTLTPQHSPEEISALTAKFVPYAQGWVRGTLYDLGDYPGVVLDEAAESSVFGTVFLIPDEPALLCQLDEYEGFHPGVVDGSLFVRKRHPVTLPDGNTVECWIYEYNRYPSNAPVVASGRYQPSARPQ